MGPNRAVDMALGTNACDLCFLQISQKIWIKHYITYLNLYDCEICFKRSHLQ